MVSVCFDHVRTLRYVHDESVTHTVSIDSGSEQMCSSSLAVNADYTDPSRITSL